MPQHWPSLKTRPVKAAKRGPTNHKAAGLSRTYCTNPCSRGLARVRYVPRDPITPITHNAWRNLLIGVTYIWIKYNDNPRPPAPKTYNKSISCLITSATTFPSGRKAEDAAITNAVTAVTNPDLYNTTCTGCQLQNSPVMDLATDIIWILQKYP